MISVVIFTFQRGSRLIECLQSLDSSGINEILIFNDDETQKLDIAPFQILGKISNQLRIFNPSDFGFNDRAFRKPFYMNKAIELASSSSVLFSDDDGIFSKGSVDAHIHGLKNHVFCAGSIIRDRLLKRKSKSILQGTNYSFQKQFFTEVGKYDESFIQSMGGGDVDFWYRIYHYVRENNLPVALLMNACQNVAVGSKRVKTDRIMDPREYTLKKHGLNLSGPMYKWFPEIRDKQKWMTVASS